MNLGAESPQSKRPNASRCCTCSIWDSKLSGSSSPFLPLPHEGVHGWHCHRHNEHPSSASRQHLFVAATTGESGSRYDFCASDRTGQIPFPKPHSALANPATVLRSWESTTYHWWWYGDRYWDDPLFAFERAVGAWDVAIAQGSSRLDSVVEELWRKVRTLQP